MVGVGRPAGVLVGPSRRASVQRAARAELTTRSGVRWQPVRNGLADIDGIDRSTIEAFSTRRRQIEAAMDRAGVHSAKAAQAAAYNTRTPKDLSLDAETLVGQWRALAAEHGLDPSHLDRSVTRRSCRPLVPTARLAGGGGVVSSVWRRRTV